MHLLRMPLTIVMSRLAVSLSESLGAHWILQKLRQALRPFRMHVVWTTCRAGDMGHGEIAMDC